MLTISFSRNPLRAIIATRTALMRLGDGQATDWPTSARRIYPTGDDIGRRATRHAVLRLNVDDIGHDGCRCRDIRYRRRQLQAFVVPLHRRTAATARRRRSRSCWRQSALNTVQCHMRIVGHRSNRGRGTDRAINQQNGIASLASHAGTDAEGVCQGNAFTGTPPSGDEP